MCVQCNIPHFSMQTVALHISRDHSECANTVGFGTFPRFYELWSNAPKIRPVGGVCVYFLKSVRKGRFRKVRVRGGG